MEISLRKFSYVSLFLLFLCGIKSQVVYAQQITVSGVITDAESGDTLPGVNIVVKGSALGTASGTDGSYQLNVPSLKDTLVFSFVGYQTREVPINGRSEINVELLMQTYAGEELVVVGYGQQKQISMTGSISQVSGDDISGVPTSSLGNALTGKVSGLTTIQTTGQPGISDPDVFLRGGSSFNNVSPLIIIDGIPSSMRDLMQLEPSSVQNISVLKDASATAVYGVRGANGVIIATTKRGRSGDIQISTKLSAGIQSPIRVLDFTDSYTMGLAYNRAMRSDGNPDQQLPDEMMEAWRTGTNSLIYPDIDWWEQMVNNSAFQTKNSIDISGGTDNARYFLSVGYLRQEGIIDGDIGGPAETYGFNFNRYNINANIDFDLTSSTYLKLTSKGRIGQRREPRADGMSTGEESAWNRLLVHSEPFGSPGIVDGKKLDTNNDYFPFTVEEAAIDLIYGKGYRDESTSQYDLNLELQQKLDFWLEGLEFNAKVNYGSNFTEVATKAGDNFPIYTPIYLTDAPNNKVPGDSTVVLQKQGSMNPDSWGGFYFVDRSLYWEGSLRYRQSFDRHEVSGLLLYNQSKDYYPGNVDFSNIPSGYVGSAARVTYNYDDRYLAEINLGYNGSENFARERRFGFFPAFSAGWVVSNEEFMQDVSFIDHLKFRASWGMVGNDRTGNSRFLYLPDQYQRVSDVYGGYNFGVNIPNIRTGATVAQIGNQNVSWETATKWNVAVETRFLDDRLSIKFDYFRELREDILMLRNTTPAFLDTPLDLPPVNIGHVENKGYEVELGWNHLLGDFAYHVSGNWSYAKNEILFMDEIPPNEPYQRQTGRPMGTNFGYIVEGFYTEENMGSPGMPVNELIGDPKPGDLLFKDVNGDGTININDQTAIGYPRVPQVNFGTQLGFDYKRFSLNTVWQGVTQVSRFLSFAFRDPRLDGPLLSWVEENSWTPERAASGQDNLLPRLTFTNSDYNFRNNSSMWVRDASYIRLKSAEIGYSLGSETAGKLGIRNLRIFLNGYNLLTFTKPEYKTLDPEKDRFGSSNYYPVLRVYNLGMNIDF